MVKHNDIEGLDESTAQWYVIHTYSGHENKVKDKIMMMVENESDDNVFDVRVPMEQYTAIKDNKRVVKERKLLPGYVLVKMNITPTSWYLIRNTHGVTGFVGPGSDPVPLTRREIAKFGVQEQVIEQTLDVEVGEEVNVIFGPFAGSSGKVEEVSQEKKTLKVLLDLFGREVSTEVSFNDIEVNH